jgi:hypothetical protein
MFSRSSSNGAGGKRSNRPRSSVRSLAMEPLEDRTLLSVTLGFRLGAGLAAIAALHGPIVPTGQTVATQLVMHLPKNVPNGVPMPVELTALDAQNHRVSNYSATVALTSTDPNAVLPTSITFENGRAVVPVTFLTAGTQSLTATDNSATPLTVTASTDVAAPRVATQIVMRLLENTTSGRAAHVLLKALDADNHLVPTFSDTVKLTSTDPNIVVPDTVNFDHGIADFEVTFNTVGEQSLTATTSSGTPLSVTANTTVAAPAVASQLVMHVRKTSISGKPVLVELAALDADNRLVKDFSGTIDLTSSDPNVVLPHTVTFRHGIAVFRVTFGTLGAQSLVATDNSATPLSVTATTTVIAPPSSSANETNRSNKR